MGHLMRVTKSNHLAKLSSRIFKPESAVYNSMKIPIEKPMIRKQKYTPGTVSLHLFHSKFLFNIDSIGSPSIIRV